MPSHELSPANSTARSQWLKLDRFEKGALFVATLILIYQIAIPPIIGINDNGDFWKIMAPAGFRHVSDNYEDMHSFVNPKFLFERPGWMDSGYYSSEILIARAAREAGLVVLKDSLFDIRVLGLTHALLLLLGFALIFSAARELHLPTRIALTLLVIVIFTDLGYVALFNTFYSQTASLIFLLIATGFISLMSDQQNGRLWPFLGFVAAAILFITSKPQEAPQAFSLAAISFLAARTLKTRFATALGVGAVIATLLISGWYYSNAPTGVRNACFYNAVFDDLLGHSPNPAADLASLKLNSDLLKYAGTHAFIEYSPVNEPWFHQAFYDQIGYGGLMIFYLKNPSRLWTLIKRKSEKAFTLVTDYRNFEKNAALSHQSQAFRLWSNLKKKIIPGSPWTLLVLFSGNLIAVILCLRVAVAPWRRLGLKAFAILNLMAPIAFAVCALGDSLDTIRHLFIFNALTDLLIIGDIAFVIEVLTRRMIPRSTET